MNIIPTVGRKVWYYENKWQVEPIDATIIKVWGDAPHSCVNLDIVDPLSGMREFKSSIQVGDENTDRPHYRWMPYQKAQASNEEAAAA